MSQQPGWEPLLNTLGEIQHVFHPTVLKSNEYEKISNIILTDAD